MGAGARKLLQIKYIGTIIKIDTAGNLIFDFGFEKPYVPGAI
jgi:hypothetical protein